MTENNHSAAQAVKNGNSTMSTTGLEGFAQAQSHYVTDGSGFARAFDPAEIYRILKRWKLLILGAAILGPMIAVGVTMLMTPLYVAQSQLQINQEDPKFLGGDQSTRPVLINNTEFLSTQIGLLKSRNLAERVVDSMRLSNDPAYADQSVSAAERRKQATDLVLSQMSVDPVRDSRLVNIVITAPDAAKAAQLANTYAEQFIANNLARDFDATAYTRRFLEDRINSTRAKLENSERQLVDYAARQGIIELGADGKGAASQSLEASSLILLNEELAKARADRIAAQLTGTQARGSAASNESNSDPVLQELIRNRAERQAEYDQKLAIFLPGLPAMIALKQQIESLDREISRQRGRLSSASALNYQAAVARERELQDRVDSMKSKVLDLRSRSIQYTILQREVDTSRALYDALLQSYKEVSVAGGIGNNKVAIVDRALAPVSPASPDLLTNMLIGLFLSLLIGVGGVVLLEVIDDTIKSPDDIKSKLHMPLLGVIPASGDDAAFAEAIADPKSDISEAAQSLRTSLQFSGSTGVPRTLLMCSSRPGEGKSSVVLALGISLSRLGKKVVILDADLRRPSYYVGKESRKDVPGLSNVMSGEFQFSSVVKLSKYANLFLVPAGPSVPNPAVLISEGGFAALLEQAKRDYDFVIVDGPPVMGLADSPLMGALVDGAVMVVEASSVHRSQVLTAASRLLSSNTRLLGAVLNKFESHAAGYGYGYAYSYAYRETTDVTQDRASIERKISIVE